MHAIVFVEFLDYFRAGTAISLETKKLEKPGFGGTARAGHPNPAHLKPLTQPPTCPSGTPNTWLFEFFRFKGNFRAGLKII